MRKEANTARKNPKEDVDGKLEFCNSLKMGLKGFDLPNSLDTLHQIVSNNYEKKAYSFFFSTN